jgi:hypothetical protein
LINRVTMSKTLIFLAFASIIMVVLSLFVVYRIFKKSMKLITALMLLGGAVVFIGIVAYPKRVKIKREVKKVLSLKERMRRRVSPTCDCTWNSLSLNRDDFTTLHKPTAKRITNGMYLINEKTRKKWINSGKLLPVDENEGYAIAKLDYSKAYLTAIARKRLYELGQRFRETIKQSEVKRSYFVVSSVTRTQVEQAAICEKYPRACTKDHSPHSYGVAFDIYQIVSPNNDCRTGLKALEKVLHEMQAEGKLLLCPESGCIHVTVRG